MKRLKSFEEEFLRAVLNLSQRILKATKRNGLVTFFIYGSYGDGKTSLLLHTSYEVLGQLYNLKNVDSWFLALDHLFFNPIEALLYVEVHRSKYDRRVPLLGMDDVGQHIPRARWWREDVVQFREWMTVARTDVAAIGFTAPTQLSLPGGIIDACFLRIKVERHKKKAGVSVAKAYEMRLSPMFQQICSGPIFEDEFPTHYPDFVFDLYKQMRERAVSPLRRHLISMMGEEETIEHMREQGATQKAIAQVIGKSDSTISRRLQH